MERSRRHKLYLKTCHSSEIQVLWVCILVLAHISLDVMPVYWAAVNGFLQVLYGILICECVCL